MLISGAASCDITHKLGAEIQGATVCNIAKAIRDPLLASALYLKSQVTGDASSAASAVELLLISCDLACIETADIQTARKRIAQATGLPERAILIGATHTHSGPVLIPTNYHKPVDADYIEELICKLVELSQTAKAAGVPAELAWGQGRAHIGYNRRCCWADGSHSMHGDTQRDDFIGLEGPDDDTHTMIALRDTNQKLIALVQANTSHPTNFYGKDFYSADFPGLSRQQLQQTLGQIPILFFNGALGDIACRDMLVIKSQINAAEQRVASLAHRMTSESLYLLYHATWQSDPLLAHTHNDLEVGVRMPDEQAVQESQALLASIDLKKAQGSTEKLNTMSVALANGTMLLQKHFADTPVEQLAIHAVRIGELALVTQPCELFCQYGLDIRRRSPAKATALLGITDGYSGYCPTPAAVMGGGYSGQPIYWTRLTMTAGDAIVDDASRLLRTLWR